MSDSWRPAKAAEAVVGDVVRTQNSDVVAISRIETNFLGRDEMIAFIEDTDERWYKRPARLDADIEIKVENA